LHTRDGAPRLIHSTAVKPRSIDNKSTWWTTFQGSQRSRQVNVLNRQLVDARAMVGRIHCHGNAEGEEIRVSKIDTTIDVTIGK
jgi:hypothetical protein